MNSCRLLASLAVLSAIGAAGCVDSSSDPTPSGDQPSNPASTGGTSAGVGGGTDTGVGASESSGGSPDTNLGVGGTVGSGGMAATLTETFTVSGRQLYDSCGEPVVLRGVNEMVVWSPGKDGVPEFAEIAKTGANVVRIVWTEEGTAAELDTAITNAVAAELIPMVEHHGATGDLSLVPDVVAYWTRTDVVAVLQKHKKHLLLNIANEAGAFEEPGDFVAVYESAITALREVGLAMPLIIDGPLWGQDIDTLQATGPGLIAHDTLSNLMFSVHMWWHDPTGARVVSELQQSVDLGLPLIVGEFAQHAVGMCDAEPFAYKVLLAEAQKHSIGWLAWSWGGVDNQDCAGEGSFDMTIGGVFGSWEETWGEEVAVSDPNSIANTSVRPQSIVTGQCL